MEGNKEKPSDSVTFVGNSWVMCQSKSRPGHNYYFNTLTGQTLWNLSDAEIEKAQKQTEILKNQPGSNFDNFPEPTDKPPMASNNQYPSTSRIYNKQIINNPFPVPQYPSQPIVLPGAFFNALNPLDAVAFNSPSPSNFNSIVWDVPPTPQVIITPGIHQLINPRQVSLINQAQASFGLASHNFPTNIPPPRMPHGVRPQNASPLKRIGVIKPNNRNGKFGYKQLHSNNRGDLRQKLHRKDFHYHKTWNVRRGEDVDTLSGKEDMNMEINRNAWGINNYQELSTKIDLTPLKKLAASDAKLERWYIVPDTNVIITYYGYLNNLTDSDETCRLMVPKHVMSNLHAIGNKDNGDMRIQRITRFLSQQIHSGQAFMAEPDDVTSDDNENLLNTCLKVAQQHHVILLSGNKELLKYNKASQIHIFTVDYLQQMLKRGSKTLNSLTKYTPARQIKITVQNHGVNNQISNRNNVKDSFVNKDEESSCLLKTIERSIKTNTLAECIKQTVNTATRTDLTLQESKNDMNTSDDHSNNLNVDTHSTSRQIDVRSPNDAPIEKIKIKLQRNVSHQKPEANNPTSEKKRFNWRSKRNNDMPHTEKPLPSTSSIGLRNNFVDNEQINQHVNITERNDTFVHNAADISTENIDEGQSISFSVSTSRYGQDDLTETSEPSIIARLTESDPNYTIALEDTSTTGVISNTDSNVGSECLFNNYQIKPYTSLSTESGINSMFEITNKSMDEYLTMRCDEWVSRFIQIMEEALSQMLQREPPFTSQELPPPWTLHEATQCIIKKFSHCYYVVDAANKLSIVLFKMSDKRGQITTNMKPSEYMEMYSYGVYLVKALQGINIECEDLEIASESLKKILFDIKNPNMEHNDTFTDGVQELRDDIMQTTNIEENILSISKSSLENEPKTMQEDTSGTDKSLKSYNLRSTKRKSVENKEELTICATLGNKSSFVSNLKLKVKDVSDESRLVNEIEQNCPDISDPNNESNAVEQQTPMNTVTANEPKIIRQFSKCSEYEQRLENRRDSPVFDFEVDNYEESNVDGHVSEEYEEGEYFSNDEEETAMIPECMYENSEHYAINADENNTKKIKNFIGILVKHVKEAFLQTKEFCEKSFHELRNPNQSCLTKQAIGKKAINAQEQIFNLCASLDNILERETNNSDNNLNVLLKRAGINVTLGSDLLTNYRSTIMRCKEQANVLLNTIQLIIQATGTDG